MRIHLNTRCACFTEITSAILLTKKRYESASYYLICILCDHILEIGGNHVASKIYYLVSIHKQDSQEVHLMIGIKR